MAPDITDEHREKLKTGAQATKAVRAYLEALEATRPKRGGLRKSADEIGVDLVQVRAQIETADPLGKLDLMVKRDRLQERLKEREAEEEARQNLDDLAKAFIDYASIYGEKRGLTYAHWREIGVPDEILVKAGIERR